MWPASCPNSRATTATEESTSNDHYLNRNLNGIEQNQRRSYRNGISGANFAFLQQP